MEYHQRGGIPFTTLRKTHGSYRFMFLLRSSCFFLEKSAENTFPNEKRTHHPLYRVSDECRNSAVVSVLKPQKRVLEMKKTDKKHFKKLYDSKKKLVGISMNPTEKSS